MPLKIPIGLLAGLHDLYNGRIRDLWHALLKGTVEARLRHVCGHEDGVLFEWVEGGLQKNSLSGN